MFWKVLGLIFFLLGLLGKVSQTAHINWQSCRAMPIPGMIVKHVVPHIFQAAEMVSYISPNANTKWCFFLQSSSTLLIMLLQDVLSKMSPSDLWAEWDAHKTPPVAAAYSICIHDKIVSHKSDENTIHWEPKAKGQQIAWWRCKSAENRFENKNIWSKEWTAWVI